MDYVKVIKKLSLQYPNSKIIKLPENNPTEILVEIDPTESHPDYSIAISVIDSSVPHYHKQVTEICSRFVLRTPVGRPPATNSTE